MPEEAGAEQTLKQRVQALMARYNTLGWYIAAVATLNLAYTLLSH